ncbi:MAG: aminopeptidase P family protein, partial [Bacteroidetes bacterium QH_2_67_10]
MSDISTVESKPRAKPPSRLDRLCALFDEHDADAALLSSPSDVRWACGFTGSNGLLLVREGGVAHFITDGRYQQQAAREVEGAEVHVTREELIDYVAEQELLQGGERVLFQSGRVTVAQLEEWEEKAEQVEWNAVSGLMNDLVAKKDESEIDKLIAAQRLTEDVFEHVTSSEWRGRTERDLAAEIVYEHLRRGADRMAFDPIVAGGGNGALPPARATDRRLQQGDLVVVDIGGVVDGYASDMTRVVAVGE